jgi:hypothetical protein
VTIEAWQLVLGVVGVIAVPGIGAYVGVRVSNTENRKDSQENHRLLLALHKRFDEIEDKVEKVQEVQARHDERIQSLKESQRFWLKESFIAAKGEIG